MLCDSEIMLNVRPGEHGSAYGNPVAARVAMAALNALIDEGMVENAQRMGEKLDGELKRLVSSGRSPSTRADGFTQALIIDDAQARGISLRRVPGHA